MAQSDSLQFANGPIYLNGDLRDGRAVRVTGGRIDWTGGAEGAPSADRIVDLAGDRLVPGFIDLQVNGGGGVLFNDVPDTEGLATIGAAHLRFGTTSWLPTVITDDAGRMDAAKTAVADAMAAGMPGVVGIHWEGPWINPAKAGVHDPAHMRPLTKAAEDYVLAPPARTLMTIAPEIAERDEIAGLAGAGAILFAGHSEADFDQAMAGFDAGITGATHLFNAMSGPSSRAPGLVGAALDRAHAWASIIADGHHVHPANLRLAARMKPGRLILVTDAMPPVGDAGAQDFSLYGKAVRVRAGVCRDAEGRLAGSALDMASAVRFMAQEAGVGWPAAIAMATEHPAQALGLAGDIGSIDIGRRADLVRLGPDGTVRGVWRGGLPA